MKYYNIKDLIEKASVSERRQFRATASVFLNTLSEKMRKERAETERKIELGDKQCCYQKYLLYQKNSGVQTTTP